MTHWWELVIPVIGTLSGAAVGAGSQILVRKRQERHERSMHLMDERLRSYAAILRTVDDYLKLAEDPTVKRYARDAVLATLDSREAELEDYADCLPRFVTMWNRGRRRQGSYSRIAWPSKLDTSVVVRDHYGQSGGGSAGSQASQDGRTEVVDRMQELYYQVVSWVPENITTPLADLLNAVGDSDIQKFKEARSRLILAVREDVQS